MQEDERKICKNSEETICQGTASLQTCPSDNKDNFTYYKLVLEPEQPSIAVPNEDVVVGQLGRSASGNDRWYPTAYCLRCCENKGGRVSLCESCCGRGKRFCPARESGNSLGKESSSYNSGGRTQPRNQYDDDSYSSPRTSQPRQNFRPQYQKSQSPNPRYQCDSRCTIANSQSQSNRHQESSSDCVCGEGAYVDMGNLGANESDGSDNWPSPRLCGQRRPKFRPRYRYVVTDHGLKECCGGSWKRNNEAMCRRLQAQLDKQSNNQSNNQSNKCCCPNQNSGRGSNRNFRYQSGEDELNVMLLKNNCPRRRPQAINCQCPVHSEPYNNNPPPQDPVRYHENQPNGQPRSENPQMQAPERYNNDQTNFMVYPCGCQYDSFRQQAEDPPNVPNYYQQNQQYEPGPTSYPVTALPNTTAQMDEFGDMCVPCHLLNDFDPSTLPPQARVYCYSTENPESWRQDMNYGPPGQNVCEECKRQNKYCPGTCPLNQPTNDDRSESVYDSYNAPCYCDGRGPGNGSAYSQDSRQVANQNIPPNYQEDVPQINNMPEEEYRSLDGRQRADFGESSDERGQGRPYPRRKEDFDEEPPVRMQRSNDNSARMGPFLRESCCSEAACRNLRNEDAQRPKAPRNDEDSFTQYESANSDYSNSRRNKRQEAPVDNPDAKLKVYPLATDDSQFGTYCEECSNYRRNEDYRDNRKARPPPYDRNNQDERRDSTGSRSKGPDDRNYQDGNRASMSSRSKDQEDSPPSVCECTDKKPRSKARPQEDRDYQEEKRDSVSSRSKGQDDRSYPDGNRASVSSRSKGPDVPSSADNESDNKKSPPKALPPKDRNYQEERRESTASRSKGPEDRRDQDGKRGSASSRSKAAEKPPPPDYEPENMAPEVLKTPKEDSDTIDEKPKRRSKNNYEDQKEQPQDQYEDNCIDENCPKMGARNRQRNEQNINKGDDYCNIEMCPRPQQCPYLKGGSGRKFNQDPSNEDDQSRSYDFERQSPRQQKDRRRQNDCNNCTDDTCPYGEDENRNYSNERSTRQRQTGCNNCNDDTCPYEENKRAPDERSNRRKMQCNNCNDDTCPYEDNKRAPDERSNRRKMQCNNCNNDTCPYGNGNKGKGRDYSEERSTRRQKECNNCTKETCPYEEDENGDYSDERPTSRQKKNRRNNGRTNDENDTYPYRDEEEKGYSNGRRTSRSQKNRNNRPDDTTDTYPEDDDENKNYSPERRQKGRSNREVDCNKDTCKYKNKDSSKQKESSRRDSDKSRGADEVFCNDETCKYKKNDSSKSTKGEGTRRDSSDSYKDAPTDSDKKSSRRSRSNSPSKNPRCPPRNKSAEKRKKAANSKNSKNDDSSRDWERNREERSDRYQVDSRNSAERSGRFLNYHIASNEDDYYSDDYGRGNYNDRNLVDCNCSAERMDTLPRRNGNGRSQRSALPRNDNRRKMDDYDYDDDYDDNDRAYNRNKNSKPAPPKSTKARGTDPYPSEYECRCSDKEFCQRKTKNGKGQGPKDDQSQKPIETGETTDKQPADNENDDDKPQKAEENESTVCGCHSDSDEKIKAEEPVADDSVKRPSAGNVLITSKSPFLSSIKKALPLGLTILSPICIQNKQFEVVENFPIQDLTSLMEQVQEFRSPSQDSTRNSLPVKKKATYHYNGPSTSFAKSSKASSNRGAPIAPKSPMGETTKRRGAGSPQGRHMTPLGIRRPTFRKQESTKDSANSKFLFDINSEQYYICKLQDDGSAKQYLILMPKEAIGGPDGPREVPGQSSAKDRHYCHRQSSGFQSVSWAHPGSTNQSQESQQSKRLDPGECHPIFPTIEWIKNHLAAAVMDPIVDTKKGIPTRKLRRKVVTKLLSSKSRKASQKANTKGTDDNRALLVAHKVICQAEMEKTDQQVVVLHPPVADFRPSRYSFDKDMAPDGVASPGPKPLAKKAPKPPAKPKRTVLR
ncbi:hypothetical protein KR067_004234 [Drosophila pandora]|nr:hypothetical protein KR067_004234 [Drosophila pandora]